MTLREHVTNAAKRLRQAGIKDSEALADAELLARHVLDWDRTTYLLRNHEPSPQTFDVAYETTIKRRSEREPVSLITQQREFWGLDFSVKPGVLIPRPETELIVETAIDLFSDRINTKLSIADIGTGSGCLAVALALEFPNSIISALDTSATALEIARNNCIVHSVTDRVRLLENNFETWLSSRSSPLYELDLIVANLPYIPQGTIKTLSPEVQNYEPHCALNGGPDGLLLIRKLLTLAPTFLSEKGFLLLEIGEAQAPALQEILESIPTLVLNGFRSDLQGIPRTTIIERSNPS
ncbi:MAG: peptide chain release factor N(5)-glutamine methyltransferase [Acidobacteriota bacterium]|nr:peptide chain release factor N(5)-glutamine methyltransferase [Acidobacteriota bacterium]